MPQYQYKGRNQNGIAVKGLATADNIEQLKIILRKNGIWVTQTAVKNEIFAKLTMVNQATISRSELVIFTKQMGVMLNSRIPLLQCLETYATSASHQFRSAILKMISEIKAGQTYTQTLAAFPRIFSPFYIGMCQIGETGGSLGEMHQKILTYLEQGETLKGKILFAMLYPGMVLGVTLIGIIIILVFAFPRIASIYKKSHIELPLITKVLLGISDFISHQWFILVILVLLVMILFLVFRIHKRPPLSGWLNSIAFKLPLYGKLTRQILLYRFTYNLALLLNSGVPLAKALEVIITITNNQIMNGYLTELLISIKKGGEMSSFLQQNNFFPSLLVSMIRTGEQSGELVKMVNDAGKFYETEVEHKLSKFIVILEPTMIIFAALIVVIVLLAFYLPMFQMFQTSKM